MLKDEIGYRKMVFTPFSGAACRAFVNTEGFSNEKIERGIGYTLHRSHPW